MPEGLSHNSEEVKGSETIQRRIVMNAETLKAPEHEVKLKIGSYLELIDTVTLQKNVLTSMQGVEGPEKRWLDRQLGLSAESSEEEKSTKIAERIMQYEKRLGELKTFMPEQVKKLKEWLDQESYEVSQQPEAVPIFVSDSLLSRGINHPSLPERHSSSFDPKTNDIVIELNESPDFVIPHEYGHAMSADTSSGRFGFRLENRSEMPDGHGNVWLDEGCTMMVERATGLPAEKQRDLSDEIDLYSGYKWLTEVFMQEVGIIERELLEAYFKPGDARERLEQKTQERFGCTIYELNDIFVGTSEESKHYTLSLIRGEPVTLKTTRGSFSEQRDRRLAEIFPNIQLAVEEPSENNN